MARLERMLLVACLLLPAAGCVEPGHVERRWTVMGTWAAVDVRATTPGAAEQAAEMVRDAFEAADASLSNWKDDSAISRLNVEARLGPVPVEDLELWRCLKTASQVSRYSEGTFDATVGPLVRLWGFRPGGPRVPSASEIETARTHVGWRKVELVDAGRIVRYLDPNVEIDFGGIGKGHAVDMAVRSFALPGIRAGLIDLGGNLYAWGAPPGEESWAIALRDPDNPDGVMATVRLVDRAVATAGGYENAFESEGRVYHHIFDPATGWPARSDVVSATVIADSGAQADALSTALFVAGTKRGSRILSKFVRIEAVLLVERADGLELLASASLVDRLALSPAYADRVGDRIRFLLPPLSIEPSLDSVVPPKSAPAGPDGGGPF